MGIKIIESIDKKSLEDIVNKLYRDGYRLVNGSATMIDRYSETRVDWCTKYVVFMEKKESNEML